AVFASSINDKSLFRRVAADRLIRIDDGVDTAKFARAASPDFSCNFVYFGRFSANKGLQSLLDAFDALCATNPDARLHLMGSDWDGTLPALQKRILGLRCRSSIKVHVDPTDDDIA